MFHYRSTTSLSMQWLRRQQQWQWHSRMGSSSSSSHNTTTTGATATTATAVTAATLGGTAMIITNQMGGISLFGGCTEQLTSRVVTSHISSTTMSTLIRASSARVAAFCNHQHLAISRTGCTNNIWHTHSIQPKQYVSQRFMATKSTSTSTSPAAATAATTTAANANKVTATNNTAAAAAAATNSATTTAGTAIKEPFSLMKWYEGHLESHPIRTKMVTGMFLWGIGDAVAQIVPSMSNGTVSELVYDWPRTGRAAVFGFALHAPTSHVHFNFLEWLTQRVGVTGLKIPIFKAFMEQFVYWSWISNSMYHGAMGAMQGQTPSQIYQRISDVLWETQKAQWVFWIPIQLLNFQYVPVRHQLNVVLLTSIVWTALLSAWYPPEDTKKPKALEQQGDGTTQQEQ